MGQTADIKHAGTNMHLVYNVYKNIGGQLMSAKRFLGSGLLVCLLVSSGEIVRAQNEGSGGAEAPRYATLTVKDTEGGPKLDLPLKNTVVRSQVTDTLAVTDITQIYVNDTGKKIETIYQFPLPVEGAVTDMVVMINERTIFGSIKPREEAVREYEEAKKAGRTASLVEQERPNMFTQSIANILPKDEIKITLRIFQMLSYSAGRFQYVFPFGIGPRYMGGVPVGRSGEGWSPDTTQVPDASRISPPYIPKGVGGTHLLDFKMELKTKAIVKKVYSTSHEIVTVNKSGTYEISLAATDRIPNKDVIVLYETESNIPQFSLLTNRQEGGDGFFVLTMIPPTVRQEGKVIPKEMIFILDRSGSMGGDPIVKARDALAKSLKRLSPGDSFNVLAFDNTLESLWPAPKAYSAERVMDAIRYVASIESRGGTEMAAPITKALTYPEDPSRQRIILFITDGNIGYEKQLVGLVRQNLGNSRIFGVGIGSSVNRYLVGEIAREGKGTSEFIRQDEDVSVRLSSIYSKISNPILTDVNFKFDGVEVYDILPEKARDLFFEEPTVILGRYRSSGSATVTIKGQSASGPITKTLTVGFPQSAKSNPGVRYAWARQKIASLELTAMGNETPELKQQITEISMRYSVLSRYTALIAVEREIRDKSNMELTRMIIPSELPEGLRFEGFGPEIQMPVSRMRPGDPVLHVRAPKDAVSVVARMPFGEWLTLRRDGQDGFFKARFVVPFGTPDGKYPVRVSIKGADGSVKLLNTSYCVDSRPPKLSFRARLIEGVLTIEAVPEEDVFITDDAEIWPDVREVVALLWDGREVKLKLDPNKKGRWIWRWEGPIPLAKSGQEPPHIKIKAVDYAGNWREEEVSIEL